MDEDRVSIQIIKYVEAQKGISYYELLEYAYNNDKHDWVQYIKGKGRSFISIYLRSKRRTDRVKYRHDLETNFKYYLEAGAHYYERLDKMKNEELVRKIELAEKGE